MRIHPPFVGTRSGRGAVAALAGLLGLVVGAQASAQAFAARQVGDWTVAVSSDGKGCFLTRDYDRPGDTTLLLGLDRDGTNHLSVLNANWSIKPKDALSLDFRFSSGGYAKHGAVGMAADGKRGFVTSFETKFPAYFAASKVLNVFRGKVPVEMLDLAGSGAAVAALRACVGTLSAQDEAAPDAKARRPLIPADPFAPEPRRKSRR